MTKGLTEAERQRKCKTCQVYKSPEHFMTGRSGGVYRMCRPCQKILRQQQQPRKKNTPRIKTEIKQLMAEFDHTKRVTGFTAGLGTTTGASD